MKKGTKAALAFAVSISLLLNAALASSAVTLESPNPQNIGWFGLSVAISGTTVVVGAFQETAAGQGEAGHAYTFDATTGISIATLTSPYAQSGGHFGVSVAISEGDPIVVVGAPLETASGQTIAGHAYLFRI